MVCWRQPYSILRLLVYPLDSPFSSVPSFRIWSIPYLIRDSCWQGAPAGHIGSTLGVFHLISHPEVFPSASLSIGYGVAGLAEKCCYRLPAALANTLTHSPLKFLGPLQVGTPSSCQNFLKRSYSKILLLGFQPFFSCSLSRSGSHHSLPPQSRLSVPRWYILSALVLLPCSVSIVLALAETFLLTSLLC